MEEDVAPQYGLDCHHRHCHRCSDGDLLLPESARSPAEILHVGAPRLSPVHARMAGVDANAQLSVVNVLAFSNSLITGFSWEYFLTSPLIFILWSSVAAGLLFWDGARSADGFAHSVRSRS